ncbi:uncharacterized protein LOC102701923 [Oryza brachyantha]|uniref:uncharacterized protein LOC102701923 n=1 Tax=Oryza brachyantha TaxID=4533 RepID=UPI0007769637|nr:uncharacterized protein LOC102701923 [Oryza brachyantha]
MSSASSWPSDHCVNLGRAIINAKTSELEETKKKINRNRNMPEKPPPASEVAQQQQGSDRAAQIKDGYIANPETASDTLYAASAKKLSSASRKRMQRSRCNSIAH